MNLIELSALMQDEKKCEEYLRGVGILKNHTNCLKCNSAKIGRVRRHRWKCYDCNYEWHIRRGSVLSFTKMEFSTFIALMNLFADGIPVDKCSEAIHLSLQVVMNIIKIFRVCLSKIDFDTFKKLNQQENISDKNPILYIYEKEGTIEVSLESLNVKDDNKKTAQVCGSRIKNKNNVICYNYILKRLYCEPVENERVYDEIDQFWSHTKPKLVMQNISRELNLYVYLKEQEIRYNLKKENLFELLSIRIVQNSWVADYRGVLW